MASFPQAIPTWGRDKIVSNLEVLVTNTETGESERPRLTAVLELTRGHTYRNDAGHRVMDIAIKRWTARGPSKLLGEEIDFIVRTAKGQPGSFVVANQAESDFPATMTFNVISDLYVGDRQVLAASKGMAVNKFMTTIPPLGGDVFEVEKEGPVEGKEAQYGDFSIRPIRCFASLAVLSTRQRAMFRLGRRLNIVPEDVYDKTLFRKPQST